MLRTIFEEFQCPGLQIRLFAQENPVISSAEETGFSGNRRILLEGSLLLLNIIREKP